MFIKKNGQLPLRVGTYNMLLKYIRRTLKIKREKELRARYINDRNKNFPIDVNSLFLVASYYYIKKTKKWIVDCG